MKALSSVNLSLGKDSVTISEARYIFYSVISKCPNKKYYIFPCSKIVQNYHFEVGIIKIQNEKHRNIIEPEKKSCT